MVPSWEYTKSGEHHTSLDPGREARQRPCVGGMNFFCRSSLSRHVLWLLDDKIMGKLVGLHLLLQLIRLNGAMTWTSVIAKPKSHKVDADLVEF